MFDHYQVRFIVTKRQPHGPSLGPQMARFGRMKSGRQSEASSAGRSECGLPAIVRKQLLPCAPCWGSLTTFWAHPVVLTASLDHVPDHILGGSLAINGELAGYDEQSTYEMLRNSTTLFVLLMDAMYKFHHGKKNDVL
jgi:hypothetical protein